MIGEPKKKLLFIHNSVPEYRIEFWRYLSESTKLTLLITNEGYDEKIYGLEKNTDGLKIEYLNRKRISYLVQQIKKSDCIILPPLDSLKELLIASLTVILSKVYKKDNILWSEKWEAKKSQQPFAKRIKNYVHRFAFKFIGRMSNKCIASGSRAANYLKDVGICVDKIHIAYDSSTSPHCATRVDPFGQYGISEEDVVVLFLGRIITRKGILDLIKAYSSIQKDGLWLVIAGEGEYKQSCIEYIEQNKIPNVVWLGRVQPRERRRYFERANVFVLPSYPEGGVIEAWGLTVNESLEVGTPVVATDAVGAAYDLLDGKSGVIVESSNVAELKNAIMTYSKFTDKDREYCKQIYLKYSVKEMAASFIRVIDL